MMFFMSAAYCALQGGDRVVFVGDDATQQGIYTRYVMDYFSLRYPGTDIKFYNAGWDGDTTQRALYRLERDVFRLKPTVVVLLLGMNDCVSIPINERCIDQYAYGMNELIKRITEAKIKIVLISPFRIDSNISSDYKDCNDLLFRTTGILKVISDKGAMDTLAPPPHGINERKSGLDLPYFNLFGLMSETETLGRKDNSKFTMMGDQFRPNQAGAAVAAYAIIKALRNDESASGLSIDTANYSFSAYRCTVRDIAIGGKEISFYRSDSAYPTYFDPEAAPVFKYVPIVEDLNSYMFKVSGLTPGKWKLTVAKMEVGTFTSEQLAEGVNLANYPGPWQVLAKRIDGMVADEQNIYFIRSRQVGIIPPDNVNDRHIQTLTRTADRYNAERKRAIQPAIDASSVEQNALINKLESILASRRDARLKASRDGHEWLWTLSMVEDKPTND